MSLQQSEAFILRTFSIGEQDKLAVFLSKDRGIIKGVAKGARKFGNRFGSSLEPLSHVHIYYYEKEHKELVVINDCDLLESYFDLQQDLSKSFTLSYFSELIEEFFPARSPDDILFRLLRSLLPALKAGGDLDLLSAYFEAWILKINGFLPSFKKCRKCRKDITDVGWLSPKRDGVYCERCASQKKKDIPPEMNQLLSWIKTNPPPKEGELPLPRKRLKEIRKIFQDIIIYHTEKEPKSLRFLQ